MKKSVHFALLLNALLLTSLSCFAQGTYNLNLTDTRHREEINFIGSEQNVHVCGLVQGETYHVWAVGFNGCHPSVKQVGNNFAHDITFLATADCMDFVLQKDQSSTACANATVWFSIGCMSCKKKGVDGLAKLNAFSGTGATELIKDVLIGGNCFDVTNVQSVGPATNKGTFEDGASTILINNGVIIASGDVSVANGPNDQNGAGVDNGGGTSDPDLDLLTGGSLHNVSGIEFDFRPTISTISFNYVFASEEYCEYAPPNNSSFNDVFGFFISGPGISGGFSSNGQDIAIIPSTGIFVSINNINPVTNSGYFVPNQANCGGTTNMNDTQFDGWTLMMNAIANVIPCETYHIRLMVADVGDGIFDSAVFLEAGSFNAGGTATGEAFAATTQSNVVYESCNDGTFIFTRAGGDNSLPLVLNFTILPSSTATSGVDYTPIPLTVTIPPGSDQVVLPVNVFADNIPEGTETIVLSLTNSCSCSSLDMELQIIDPPPLELDLPDLEACVGSPITVEAMPTGGIPNSTYTFSWSNGGTGSTLLAVPTQNTTYTVTVTDVCGATTTASSNVEVSQLPSADLNFPDQVLCSSNPQGYIDIPVTFTGQPNWILNYSIDGVPQNPVVVTSSPYFIHATTPGIYLLTGVTSEVGGCDGPVSGVTVIQSETIVNSVETTQFTCSEAGTMTVIPSGGQDPYNYVWSNGFPSFETNIGLSPGNYSVTVTDVNGCFATATGTITTPPPLLSTAQGSQISCNSPNGGTITLTVGGGTEPYSFLWSDGSVDQNPTGLNAGTYTVTVTDAYGCVSSASATVVSNVDVPNANAISIEVLDCSTQTITVLGTGSEIGPTITYEWSGPLIVGVNNQIDVNVQSEGTYILTVTDASNGCTSTASVDVLSNYDPPTANAIGNIINCNENFTTILGAGSSVGPEYQYTWTGPNILGNTNDIDAIVGQAGTYTLTVTNTNNGCTAEAYADVENNSDLPTAFIEPPLPLTCVVNSVTLDGQGSSSGAYSYQWLFNNNPIPGATGLTTDATSIGTYQIVVTDLVNGCSSSYSTTVTQNVATLSPTATASGQITCSVGSVPLSSTIAGNLSNYTFQWSTANGSINGNTNSQNATAASPGTYQVLVTDIATGCTGTATAQVTQDASIPVVQVTSSGNIDCVDTQVQLDGTGSSQGPNISFTWSTTDGTILSGGNTLTPIVNAAGTYVLSILDSNNNCDNESSVTVSVDNVPPNIVMPASPTLDCAQGQANLNTTISNAPTGGGLTYSWTTTDGQIVGSANVLSPNVNAPGTYVLVVSNPANGCTSTNQVVVNQDIELPNVAIATPDVLTCTSNTVPLDATGTSTGSNFEYEWSSPTGTFSTSNTILNPTVTSAGTYTLLVTNTDNSCTSSQQVVVNADVNLPTATAGAPLTLNCSVTELNLNGTGSSAGQEYQYLWTGPGVIEDENTLSPLINQPGTYQLLVTNTANNCQSTASVTIGQDINPPLAEAGNGGTLSCTVTSMTLDGAGSSTGNNFSYAWDSQNGNVSLGANTLFPTITAPGIYQLVVTNTTNGCTSTDEVQIDQDDSLPDAETVAAPPITCNITEVTLDGTGSAVGSEFNYQWTTSNGSIFSGANTLNPVVTAAGTYLLQVTNTTTNCSSFASVTVASQTALPVVEAGPASQLTCTATSLQLNGAGSATGSNYSYLWSTIDGNIFGDNTILNPMVDEPGTYILTITNNQTGCVNSDQVIISQSLNAPVSVATTPGLLTCTNSSLTLSGQGSSTGGTFTYQWTTVDGNVSSGGNTLSPVITEPGTYILTVSNSANGCTETASVVVGEDITAPTAEAGTANLLSCNANTITLNGSGTSTGSGFTYLWSTNNGNIVSGGTTLTPVVNQVGNYVLTVTNTANGCTSSDNIQVGQDNSLPQAVITPPATLSCDVLDLNLVATASQGADFSYLWSTTNGNIVTGETSLSPQVDMPGTYVLLVTNSTNGCTITAQTTVNQDIIAPNANAGAPFVMDCFEELNHLDGSGSSANGTIAFLWSTQNGNLVSGANTPNPSVSEAGTYLLIVTNLANGCTAEDEVAITREGPVSAPETLQPPCFGDKGAITLSDVTGGITPYLYSIDNGAHFGSSSIFTNLEPGIYATIVQDANGCEDDKEIEIVQPDQFNIEVEPQVTLDLGDSYQINTLVNVPISEVETVNWFPAYNLSCTDCLNPIASPTESYTYTVDVVTKNGCKDSAPIFLRVDKTEGVYIPNAFSPNGDGTNDVFMIFSNTKSVSKVKSFLVFNRWGESVYQYFDFEPNNPAYGWDGSHRAQKVDPAVFTWFAEIEFIDGRVELFKGDVTLMN